MLIRKIFLVIFLIFSLDRSVYPITERWFEQVLDNLRKEETALKAKYTKEKIDQLDAHAVRGKTYSSRLRSIYQGIADARKMLASLRSISVITSNMPKGIVFIDPGHGGNDSGATIPPIQQDGKDRFVLTEAELTFRISQRIKQLLEQEGYFVVLSREKLEDGASLFARSALCRAINPDVSVSVHLNSTQYAYPVFERSDTAMPEINYTRVFVWGPGAYDMFYPFYKHIHTVIQQTGSRRYSRKLAQCIVERMNLCLDVPNHLPPKKLAKLESIKKLRTQLAKKKAPYRNIKSPQDIDADAFQKNMAISMLYKKDIKNLSGVEAKDLHMVREMPGVPSVLVEAVFLSAPSEQKKFLNGNRINDIATGIATGILEYFNER